MTQLIHPTPGRVVWYYPTPEDGIARLKGQPLAAIIAGVHSDRLVNLAVFDSYGNAQQRSYVKLAQPDEERPNFAHATWIPYQIGQAAKTEQVEKQLDAVTAASDPFAEAEPVDPPQGLGIGQPQGEADIDDASPSSSEPVSK